MTASAITASLRDPKPTAPRANPTRRVSLVAIALLLTALLAGSGLERFGLVQTDLLLRLPLVGIGHTSADGVIASGEVVTVADTDLPAIARLDPELRAALGRATAAAGGAGLPLTVTSGWRSEALQRDLFIGGVLRHGGIDEAKKWVSTPSGSHHTSGHAVDVGPIASAVWLQENGSRFGLCRTFENEWWHFELATDAGGSCPARIADAAAG